MSSQEPEEGASCCLCRNLAQVLGTVGSEKRVQPGPSGSGLEGVHRASG